MTVQHQWKQFREQSCTALNNNSVLQQEEINHFHGHGRPEISGSFKSVFSWPGKVMDINQILKVMGMSMVNIHFSEISVVCYCSCKGKKTCSQNFILFHSFESKRCPNWPEWFSSELVWIRMIFKWLEWKKRWEFIIEKWMCYASFPFCWWLKWVGSCVHVRCCSLVDQIAGLDWGAKVCPPGVWKIGSS